MNQDFKELEKNYLDSMTFYDDDKLEDGETVELDESEIQSGENTPIQIMRLGIICAGSDIDCSYPTSTLMEAYFMILCDIARSNNQKTIKVQSGEKVAKALGDYVFSFQDSLDKKILDDVIELAKNRSADMEEGLDYKPEYDIPREAYSQDCYRLLKEELDLITDANLKKLVYKYAYFLTKADSDQGWGYREVMVHNMFSGDEPTVEVQDQTHEELHCLEIIKEHYDFDEDMIYGFQRRLEDGELGYL